MEHEKFAIQQEIPFEEFKKKVPPEVIPQILPKATSLNLTEEDFARLDEKGEDDHLYGRWK